MSTDAPTTAPKEALAATSPSSRGRLSAPGRETPSVFTRAIDAMVRRAGKIGGRLAGMEKPVRARGFICEQAEQEDIFNCVVRSFAGGYHLALDFAGIDDIVDGLLKIEPAYRGFAFEGAGMGLCLRECLVPGRNGLVMQLAQAESGRFTYLVHVGAGWILGWAPGAAGVVDRLDPLLKWLAYDGLGFREAFFKWSRYGNGASAPGWLHGYQNTAFDQGLGRCLWFTAGGNAQRVVETISVFAEARQPELWAGAGLAVTYAGRLEATSFWQTHRGKHAAAFAQGISFAAKALATGGQLSGYHDRICRDFTGLTALEAAAITDRCLEGLELFSPYDRYSAWQAAIRRQFEGL